MPVTLAEVAAQTELLDPPMSEQQLTRIIAQLPGFLPTGVGSSTGGRPPKAYDLAEVQLLHHVLRRWL